MQNKQKERLLTKKGLLKIENRLEFLKVEKRKEVGERIKEARAFGDLSENSEYDEAKNNQAEIEMEIERLEELLKYSKVVDEKDIPKDAVYIGTKVKVYDKEFKEEIDFEIVGAGEADPFENKISNESPLGEALLYKKVGDDVEVDTPGGISKYTILEIKR